MTKESVALQRNEPVISRKALLQTLEDRQTDVTLWQQRPFSCVVLHSWYNGKNYTGYGFSKVCYPDNWEPESGANIAHRRALIMILRQVRNDERQPLPLSPYVGAPTA